MPPIGTPGGTIDGAAPDGERAQRREIIGIGAQPDEARRDAATGDRATNAAFAPARTLMSRRRATRLLLTTALLGVASLASAGASLAQEDARLEVALPARAAGGADGPSFAPKSVLASGDMRDLLRGGFPARLHFRCELWRNERFNNQIDQAVEWDMLVRFDQLSHKFEVYRIAGDHTSRLGRFDTAEEAEAAVEQPFRIKAPPMRRGNSYYYDSSLDIEVLSLSDLNEVERWLRGEVRPALSGDRNPGTAVTRTVRGFFVKLLGGERRHYQTQTKPFVAE